MGNGEKPTVKIRQPDKLEQRVHNSTGANAAWPRPWLCRLPASSLLCSGKVKGCCGDSLRSYSQSLRSDSLQKTFVYSFQTYTVLCTHVSSRIQARQTKRQQLQRLFI